MKHPKLAKENHGLKQIRKNVKERGESEAINFLR